MDALTGLLDGPRARGAFLLRMIMEPPWSVRVQDHARETDEGRHTSGVRFTAITPEQCAWLRQVLGHLKQPER